MSELLLTNARILTPSEEIPSGCVLVTDGSISYVGAERPDTSAPAFDLEGRRLVPGFIDLHVHGGGGADFTTERGRDTTQATRWHARHGTTALLATTVAASPETLRAAVESIRALAEDPDPVGAIVLGAHLEGPWLNAARKGALDPRWLRPVDEKEAALLLEAGKGKVRMVSLAPELEHAARLIRLVSASGAVAAVGHTDASYDKAMSAFESGATHAIHLFNGMRPFHHRDPGVIGAALDHGGVTVELILDGVHVLAPAARLVWRLKGAARTTLVTDAVAAAGMPDGGYTLGGRAIRVSRGEARLAEGDSLAGSTLTMDAAIRFAVDSMGVSLASAVESATTTPARVIGVTPPKGRVAQGYDADLVILDEDLRVRATMVGGRWVHRESA